jgi:hypothetical protein
MIGKFVLIFVLTGSHAVGSNGSVPFDAAAHCLAAKADMVAKLGDRLRYVECFPTGRET